MDRTDLASGGQLSDEIARAVTDSMCLIVVCTPQSANSAWVNAEVRLFLEKHGPAAIFPIIAPDAGSADDVEASFYPEALRGIGLLASDWRSLPGRRRERVGDGQELGRTKLLAGLLGVDLDVLRRRERHRQRVVAGLATAAAAAFAVVSVAAGGFAVLAQSNANRADLALKRTLVENASVALERDDLVKAGRLALAAAQLLPNESEGASEILAAAILRRRGGVSIPQASSVSLLMPGGDKIVVGGLNLEPTADPRFREHFYRGNLTLWSFPEGSLLKVLSEDTSQISALSVDANGQLLAAGADAGGVYLVSLTENRSEKIPVGSAPIVSVSLSLSGRLLAVLDRTNRLSVWETQPVRKKWEKDLARPVMQVEFSRDGAAIAITTQAEEATQRPVSTTGLSPLLSVGATTYRQPRQDVLWNSKGLEYWIPAVLRSSDGSRIPYEGALQEWLVHGADGLRFLHRAKISDDELLFDEISDGFVWWSGIDGPSRHAPYGRRIAIKRTGSQPDTVDSAWVLTSGSADRYTTATYADSILGTRRSADFWSYKFQPSLSSSSAVGGAPLRGALISSGRLSTLDLDRYGDLAKPDEAWVGPGLARHVALPQQGNAAAATVLSLSSIPGTTVWEDYRWPLKKVVEADGDFVRGGGFSARGGFINRPIEDSEDVGRARAERKDEDAILSDFWVSDLRAGRDRIETLSAPPGAKPWEDYVDQILVSKDGRTVVGFREGVLLIWRRNTGWTFLRKLNVDYGLNPSMTSAGDLAAIAALSGSGDKLIYVAADQAIMRLDIGSGAVATLRAGKPSRRIVGLAYAESVQSIIFLELPERGKPAPEDERDDGLRSLSMTTGEERFVDDNFRGGSLLLPTISSDGSLLAALSLFDQTVRVWNAGTLKEIAVIKPESGTLGELRFLGGGRFLASLSDNQLAVLSVATGRTLFVQSLDTHDWGRYVGVEVNAGEDQLAVVFEDKLALFDFSLLGAAPQAIVVRACRSLFGGAANFSRREIDADPVLGVVWPDHERELCPDATVGK